jgi:hypothetical protein
VGGVVNTASGNFASVSGGADNVASGALTSVSGGERNTASQSSASVSGGFENMASGLAASVSGGRENTARGNFASVSGGLSKDRSWRKQLGGWPVVRDAIRRDSRAGINGVTSTARPLLFGPNLGGIRTPRLRLERNRMTGAEDLQFSVPVQSIISHQDEYFTAGLN